MAFFIISDNNDISIHLLNVTGEVMFRIKDEWKSVCDNHWTNEDAAVVCREIELPYSGMIYYTT